MTPAVDPAINLSLTPSTSPSLFNIDLIYMEEEEEVEEEEEKEKRR